MTAEAPIGEPRAARRDAVENRTRILAAAEDIFAIQGTAAPMDEIARRAGLGVGTLYRHFPSKERLLEAICEERIESVIARLAELAEVADPETVLIRLFEMFAELSASKRDFLDALQAADDDWAERLERLAERLRRGVEPVLVRAQRAGIVRDDLEPSGVFALIAGTCTATAHTPPSERPKLLEVLRVGLRPR